MALCSHASRRRHGRTRAAIARSVSALARARVCRAEPAQRVSRDEVFCRTVSVLMWRGRTGVPDAKESRSYTHRLKTTSSRSAARRAAAEAVSLSASAWARSAAARALRAASAAAASGCTAAARATRAASAAAASGDVLGGVSGAPEDDGLGLQVSSTCVADALAHAAPGEQQDAAGGDLGTSSAGGTTGGGGEPSAGAAHAAPAPTSPTSPPAGAGGDSSASATWHIIRGCPEAPTDARPSCAEGDASAAPAG